MGSSLRKFSVGLLIGIAAIGCVPPLAARASSHALLVPSPAYPSIQAAVDAARPGDQIKVRPGRYREQVSIGKSLTITGSGARSTLIVAPEKLVAGEDGQNSIVEVRAGASVRITQIGVTGPAAGSCDDNALEAGIRVLGGAHLDLSLARVTHIRNSPIVGCFHAGNGILVGIITDPASGSANIRDSEISDYGRKGIIILSEGPGTITRNHIIGPTGLSADGIDALFAESTISYNVVSGNVCPSGCGPDPINDIQKFAILFGGGPHTVVTHNLAYANQVGLFGLGGDTAIEDNLLLHNTLYGLFVADGDFTPRGDLILGGVSGFVAATLSADTHADVSGERILGSSGPPVITEECCGFTATVSGGP